MRHTFITFGFLTALGLIFLFKMRNTAISLEEKPNGFKRDYLECLIKIVNRIDIGNNWPGLAGSDDDHIYFSGDTIGVFLNMPFNLRKTSRMDIGLSISLKCEIGSSFTSILDSEYIHFITFSSPKLISYNRCQHKKSILLMTPGVCTGAAGTYSSKLFLRKYKPEIQDQLFYCLDLSNSNLKLLRQFLPIFHDGGMATDGQLNWDNSTKHLIYNCFHSNSYFVIDTLFQHVKEFHSIDTFRSARLHVIRQGQYFTAAGNSQAINKYSAVYNGRLFLLSTLRGDNEDIAQFKSGSSIDIYDYSKGKYLGSIKIPHFKGESIRQFLITKTRIFALYPSTLIQYKITDNAGTLNDPIFPLCHLGIVN